MFVFTDSFSWLSFSSVTSVFILEMNYETNLFIYFEMNYGSFVEETNIK